MESPNRSPLQPLPCRACHGDMDMPVLWLADGAGFFSFFNTGEMKFIPLQHSTRSDLLAQKQVFYVEPSGSLLKKAHGFIPNGWIWLDMAGYGLVVSMC